MPPRLRGMPSCATRPWPTGNWCGPSSSTRSRARRSSTRSSWLSLTEAYARTGQGLKADQQRMEAELAVRRSELLQVEEAVRVTFGAIGPPAGRRPAVPDRDRRASGGAARTDLRRHSRRGPGRAGPQPAAGTGGKPALGRSGLPASAARAFRPADSERRLGLELRRLRGRLGQRDHSHRRPAGRRRGGLLGAPAVGAGRARRAGRSLVPRPASRTAAGGRPGPRGGRRS